MRGDQMTSTTQRTLSERTSRFTGICPRGLRSLTVKLTLAFLCVGLLGALMVAFFVGLRTQHAVDQFVADRGRQALLPALAEHYASTGSWTGVENGVRRAWGGRGAPGGPSQPVIISNADGQVVLGGRRYPTGARLPARDRAKGVPIQVDNATVGWLISDLGQPRMGRGSPEADLLARISGAITYSAVGAVGLALVLGVLLARTLTHPLRELTAATEVVAQGRLGQRVPVGSRDELGALAASFNRMSTDLAHASALRRQMTADIAHDLRTPLSVILGYTEALRHGKLPPDPDIFDTLHTEAQHLQHLIDDLRTLSLAYVGELPLNRQPVAPRALLERAAAAHLAQAQAQQIAISVAAPADLAKVSVDPERMAQVLGNLLSNALRHTPGGGSIRLAAEGHGNEVHLYVQDSGTGIPPEGLPHIFERFYRVDPSRQHDGSSGLGLAIAKSIVEAHGGRIGVESALGSGTTFTIALPAGGPEAH